MIRAILLTFATIHAYGKPNSPPVTGPSKNDIVYWWLDGRLLSTPPLQQVGAPAGYPTVYWL